MKKRLRGLLLGLSMGFFGMFLLGVMVSRNLALEGTYTYLKLFNEVLSLVNNSYVDDVEVDSVMRGAYKGLLSELDPFSEYMTSEQHADYLRRLAEELPEGGAPDAGIRVARKSGILTVVAVRPGSDAAAHGITSGDRIRRIGDDSTRDMPLFRAEALLSTTAGTKVPLSLVRRDEPRKLDADVEISRIAPLRPTLEEAGEHPGAAVLRIPTFEAGTAEGVSRALQKARELAVRRVLIDLRGNAWGSMEEAAETASLFTGPGVAARLAGSDGSSAEILGGRRAAFAGVVAVLVDAGTAEAAELFAAALRDGHGAKVMGEETFGIGAEQELLPLKNGGYLKLSVRKYLSPAGASWHGKGLSPDLPMAVAQENLSAEERRAQQLRQALEQLKELGSV